MPVANPSASGALVLLYKLTGADMQSTADQAFTKVAAFNEAVVLNCIAMPKTGAASVACAGGIYDATAKGGNAFLGAGASWVTLSATASPKVYMEFASFGGGTQFIKSVNTGNIWLSLTTGSTAACTADIMIYGFIMS
jgi:hypothetical protein